MFLDGKIERTELVATIAKCTSGKTTGINNISYEFYKNLPSGWMDTILYLLNIVLENESIPTEWTESEFTTHYKNGCKETPSNYRCIALLSTIIKIFTNLIANRLGIWSEHTNTIPETQTGFKKQIRLRRSHFHTAYHNQHKHKPHARHMPSL